MKLKLKSSFSVLPILLITFSQTQTQISKKQTATTQEQSNSHWHNYGDNWSQWAENWSIGWSQDDKHATNLTSDDCESAEVSEETLIDNENVTLFGSKEMVNKKIKKNLTIYGAARLGEVSVGEVMTDFGRLKAQACTFNQLDAHGCSSFEKCIIQNDAKIYGLLDARSSTFKSSLTVWASDIVLTKCKIVGNIIVKRDKGTKKQRIELVDTVIEGSVTFEKNKGTVILKGTSAVKKGVVGGKIVGS